MPLRLFFALPLPEDMASDLAAACRGLSSRCGRARWTAEGNLHVTVLFVGEVSESVVPDLHAAAARVCAASAPFSLTARGIVAAPPHRAPTMLWLDFAPSEDFRKLADGMRREVSAVVALPSNHQDTLPHVTLARFRDVMPSSCMEGIKNLSVSRTFTANRCKLFESSLGPNGPTYRCLETLTFHQ